MPDYTVSADVDSMLRSANDAAIRSAIGVGTTDAPTFLALTAGTGLAKLEYTVANGLTLKRSSDGAQAITLNAESNMITAGSLVANNGIIRNGANNTIFELGTSGTVEQRNGVNKQVHRVYNTFLGTTANEWGGFDWLTTTNTMRIGTEHGGTGQARPIDFVTGGTKRAGFTSGGNFDVIYNLSTAATFYFGASFNALTSPSAGVVKLSNLGETDFGRLQLGGTTSAFPAIKRNGAGIDIRLADDSAFASLMVGSISASVGSSLNAFGDIFALAGRSLGWNAGAARMRSLAADTGGVITLFNSAETGFTRLEFGATNLGISRGTGSPEGVVTALVGSLYIRTDGGASTTLYVKESSPTPSTGWVAK